MVGIQIMDGWKRQDKSMFAGHNMKLDFVIVDEVIAIWLKGKTKQGCGCWA